LNHTAVLLSFGYNSAFQDHQISIGMDKTYSPKDIEQRWYQQWESQGYFEPSGEGESYCIMIPPPNVTGTLHMGHAFQDTVMDALIRYHRMQGNNTLWQPGTDHAGIATQMIVEKQLKDQGQTRHDLGREKFIERVWDWKQQSGGTITKQLRRLGASPDWSRERFTMDEGLSESVGNVFERLYDEGLIYRGKRLVNWDPVHHTALSDIEVLNEEENGHMWHFRYPLADDAGNATDEHLIVATTRPETMLGDSAVAVHPEDERYQHLIGKFVKLPLVGRLIPIVGDDYADPEKGTGCVKITPAHDFNDYEVGKRHDLEIINIFDDSAAVNDTAPEQYQGLDRFVARKQIVADLDALGLLDEVKAHTLQVPRAERSNSIIEPYMTDQWYVKIAPLAGPAIEAVESGRIKFVPDNYKNMYFSWMNDIQDWCISRQLWWGHRIPAWYDESGKVYVGKTADIVIAKYDLPADIVLRQDDDVLDTWFSSALWPFSTLGWPDNTDALKTFYPTNVLVTGFDIIFFWVARMIMFGLKFMDGEVPFKEVYMHGLVRDTDGQKMSKSKGNVIDPLDVIDGISLPDLLEKRTSNLMQDYKRDSIAKATKKQFPDGIPAYGTDALRFTFATQATSGRDVRFDLQRIEGNRNFCNKLWNAARYVQMQTDDKEVGVNNPNRELSQADRWIISRLQHTAAEVAEHFEKYRFDLAAKALYEFSWNEYCDWYLELSKPILFADDVSDDAKQGTRHTLVSVFESLMRMLHPIMPYITEEIWQSIKPLLGNTGDTIMLQTYPQADKSLIDATAETELGWTKLFIESIRRIRSEMDIKPGKALPVLVNNWTEENQRIFNSCEREITSLAKLESVTWLCKDDAPPESATGLVGEMQILIPLAGLIDKDAETARLNREIEKINKQLQGVMNRLNNPSFADKAPANVVAQVQKQADEQQSALEQLQQQLAKIAEL